MVDLDKKMSLLYCNHNLKSLSPKEARDKFIEGFNEEQVVELDNLSTLLDLLYLFGFDTIEDSTVAEFTKRLEKVVENTVNIKPELLKSKTSNI